jgi:PAS domain S-box-containing protein
VAVVRDITERKQAESRLRRTQYAVDHATDYIFLIGDDGYFLDINESACRRLGYTKEELLTKSVMDIDPDCPPDVWKSIWDEFKRKKLLRLETKHRSKSGEIYPVEVVATYLLHEGKELDYAFVRDISERKAAEEALRSSEERFSLAVRGSNTGIWDWDLRTNKTNFSPLWKSMLGYEDHELLGEFSEWEERLHPDDRERALATVRSYLEGTTPQYELEHRLRHKDGSYRWILARGVSISDAGGKPYRMAGSHIDITEQKQIQEALAQHERQLQTVLDALPVGVWFTDSSGKPLLANPAAKQIWSGIKQVGIETAANAAGWWETIGSSSEPHRWALSHVLTKGVPSLYETLDFECLDGTKKTIRNTAVPVQDEAGIVLGAIVLNEDITALRRAQEAIKLTQFSVDHAVEAFFWIGPDAKILHVNEAACRILEYTQDELTSMTMHDIDPNFLPELWQAYWEDLKQKGSLTFESKHWSRTGRVLDTEVTVNYLQYDGREYNCAIMRDIGERKRADEALRTSEERYRSLLDNAPIGIFLNEGGRFTYVNWEMQRILQATSPEQLIGMPVLDRIAPEFHQVVQARIQQLMEKGQPAPSLDEQFVRLDGSRVDVAVTAIPTIFNGTTVMQVLVLDITERKKAEEALREKHALLSTIMDATADIIFVKDLQGRYLHMNPAGARAVGMSVEEVAGKDDDALWPADLAACCKAADQNIMTSGTAQTMEESTTVDGDRITYLTTKAPYRDAAGRMIGIIGVAHDISQMKRSEEELRRAHAFLRQVIDIDPNFVFAKDRAGRFTLVNKAVADAYGTTVENLIGKTDADFNANQKEVAFSRETDLEVLKSLQDLFLPEAVITDSTGKIRWLQTVKRPLFNEQGQAIMVLGSATDITERKRMEEALRQRERDLRAAIEERERISQDLHDGILQSLFAVGLSLETTKSMLSLKERKTSGPALQQAIDQLNRLMHEVRNFIAGLGSDLLKGTDLPTALHHMLETLTKNYPTHVRLKIEDRAAQALSAEQSLHLLLVIQEAVSNCIRHGHAQEATVSLKLLKQGVRLSVRDNGCGFDLAASKGIGHGLANMAARAQKIGGRLTVLSKTNEGTRLVLDLPKEAVLAYS